MNTQLQQKAYRYLRFTNIKGFCSVADNSNLHTGVANMLGLAGVGKVRPNILMMGFKNDWSTCDPNLLDQYVLAVKYVLVLENAKRSNYNISSCFIILQYWI